MNNFERLYREGQHNARVMAIAVHPYISGAPFRSKYFEQALDEISKHDDVELWTGGQVADWYRTVT
tara:strand:- start:898 stop:1095 length:198 start_codon:yes stop_codon:yes gene_type:complete